MIKHDGAPVSNRLHQPFKVGMKPTICFGGFHTAWVSVLNELETAPGLGLPSSGTMTNQFRAAVPKS